MTANQFYTIFAVIVGIAFLLWIISQMRKTNVVVVNETINDSPDRIIEQPITQPIYTQPIYSRPVFNGGFDQGGSAPSGGGAMSGARVAQNVQGR